MDKSGTGVSEPPWLAKLICGLIWDVLV